LRGVLLDEILRAAGVKLAVIEFRLARHSNDVRIAAPNNPEKFNSPPVREYNIMQLARYAAAFLMTTVLIADRRATREAPRELDTPGRRH
jgi:hypothetical protein